MSHDHFCNLAQAPINTDGVALSAPGTVYAGGVFRTHDDLAISSFVAPLGTCYTFEAELSAIIIAMQKASSMSFANL